MPPRIFGAVIKFSAHMGQNKFDAGIGIGIGIGNVFLDLDLDLDLDQNLEVGFGLL